MTPFDSPDFAAHESVHCFADPATGLRAFVAIHSTARGPAAGGCRFWSYAGSDAALTDALRLARGMSYKNALAGLPLGGGKAVVLKPSGDFDRAALFAAFGRAVDALGGRYVTAEDVGTTVADMRSIASTTRFVGGLAGHGNVAGGDPSPSTAWGVSLGLREAWSHLRGRAAADLAGVRVALVAGAANNQLATREDGERLRRRGILYAPDYVINAGGIIRVACEYLRQGSESEVRAHIARIPGTLRTVLEQAARESLPTDVVADRLAERALQAPATAPQSELPRLRHAHR